jgi:hypothetical protein
MKQPESDLYEQGVLLPNSLLAVCVQVMDVLPSLGGRTPIRTTTRVPADRDGFRAPWLSASCGSARHRAAGIVSVGSVVVNELRSRTGTRKSVISGDRGYWIPEVGASAQGNRL